MRVCRSRISAGVRLRVYPVRPEPLASGRRRARGGGRGGGRDQPLALRSAVGWGLGRARGGAGCGLERDLAPMAMPHAACPPPTTTRFNPVVRPRATRAPGPALHHRPGLS